MTLRLQINLVLGAVIAAFLAVLLVAEIAGTRASVREETTAANKVAQHLLGELAELYSDSGLPAIEAFLQRLGHVRSADITLLGLDGEPIYHSPPATYKAGRDAPQWYAHLVQPEPMVSEMQFSDARLIVDANASRAVLDGWDDGLDLARTGIIVLTLGLALVLWLTRRATQPFRSIVAGLERIRSGDYQFRLPEFRTAEAREISRAFNAAAGAIQGNLQARREATEARLQAEHSAGLVTAIQERLEEQRRQIAHELHDETSQSITAIRALALALTHKASDARTAEIAATIADTAGRLYDAVHELIPRLDAPELDRLGLADAIDQLVADWRASHPGTRVDVRINLPPDLLGPRYTLTAYRIVQEATTNVYRHAGANQLGIALEADAQALHITVSDNGTGLPDNWQRPGHYGLRWMQERAQALGGSVQVENKTEGGVCVRARLPLT